MAEKKKPAPDRCCIYLLDKNDPLCRWYLTPANNVSRSRYDAALFSPSKAMSIARSMTVFSPDVSRVVELWVS